MKQMFPLAWAGLKSRKRSTVLLLSTIILSVMFLVVMGLIGSSSLYTIDRQKRDLYGDQKAVAWNLSDEQKTQFEKSTIWDEIGKIKVCGAVSSETGEFLGVGTMDETARKLGHIRLTEGRWPQAADEIVLEKDIYKHIGKQPYAVGDAITLEIAAAGQESPQPFTFQVVGLTENYSAVWKDAYAYNAADGTLYPPLASFVIADQEAAFYGEITETWLLNSPSESYTLLCDSLPEKTTLTYNHAVYPQLSFFGGTSEANRNAIGLIALLGGMILVCMMVILLNGFLMSVDRRQRQLSLLRCIGATQKQAYSYLFCESFLLLGLGIPAGFLLGVPISVGAVQLFGKLNGSELIYRFNGWILVLAAVVCVLCVCLATLLPAVRASRTAPIAGTRTVYFKRKKGRKKRPGKTALKPFGLMLLSLRKSKGKTVLTSLTFALVIVVFNVMMLFSMVAYLPAYEIADVSLSAGSYRYEYILRPGDKADGVPPELPEQLRSRFPVKGQSMEIAPMFACSVPFSQYDHYLNGYFHYDRKELGWPEWQSRGQYDYFFDEQQQYGYTDQEFLIMPEIAAFDEYLLRALSPYVTDGRLDVDAISRGEEVVLCMPDYAATFHGDENGYGTTYSPLWADPVITEDTVIYTNTNWKAGDTLTFTWVELQEDGGYQEHAKTVRIGAVVKDAPAVQGAPRAPFGMFVDEQTLVNLGLPFSVRQQYLYFQDAADITQTEMEIEQFISREYPRLSFTTGTETRQAQRQTRLTSISIMSMLSVCLLALGFLGLMNTVSSRVHSRLHEIGLLRCIGMTKGQVYRMFVYEGAAFGVLASLLGIAGCLFILPKFQGNWLHTQTPLYLVLSCIVCMVLAVCTVFLPVRGILKKNPTQITQINE